MMIMRSTSLTSLLSSFHVLHVLQCFFVWIGFISLFSTSFMSVQGLSAHLRPNERLCLFEDVKGGTRFTISFQIGYGGDPNIIFWVSDPAGTSLYTVANEHTGNFEYTAVKDGAYTYCFTNHASVSIVNPVQFTFFQETDLIGDPKALVDPVQKSIDQLSKAIHGVKAEQRYFSHREKAHFATANSSNVRILWWSILQVLTLVGVCLFQVFYLKHFFETKRRL